MNRDATDESPGMPATDRGAAAAAPAEHRVQSDAPPLCVDLDGTLTPRDTLHHLIARLAFTRPWLCLDLPLHALAGKARFKACVSDRIAIDAVRLPYRAAVLDYLKKERDGGRRLVLATAADHRIAAAVAAHVGLFDLVLATRAGTNLSGSSKRDMIRAAVGPVFDYIGDGWVDLPIFQAARYALLVKPPPRLRAAAAASCRVLHVFD